MTLIGAGALMVAIGSQRARLSGSMGPMTPRQWSADRRVYGADHPGQGPRLGERYAELTGGPLDGLLLDVTWMSEAAHTDPEGGAYLITDHGAHGPGCPLSSNPVVVSRKRGRLVLRLIQHSWRSSGICFRLQLPFSGHRMWRKHRRECEQWERVRVMDPAVTAALISAPVTITAAGAAFAAGLMQGRAARRGPVGAVRRQHQRDAYATLLAALHAYENESDPHACEDQARAEFRASGAHYTPEDLARRMLELVAAVPIKEVLKAQALVELEGPEHVASASAEAMTAVCDVHFGAVHADRRESINAAERDVLSEHGKLYPALSEFTAAASAELNRAD